MAEPVEDVLLGHTGQAGRRVGSGDEGGGGRGHDGRGGWGDGGEVGLEAGDYKERGTRGLDYCARAMSAPSCHMRLPPPQLAHQGGRGKCRRSVCSRRSPDRYCLGSSAPAEAPPPDARNAVNGDGRKN